MNRHAVNNGRHPCFDQGAHHSFGRMHLPVAGSCNVQCGFCDRRYACVNESRPGVTASLLSSDEAVEAAVRAAEAMPNLSVVGIAGPGDPLADAETTLRTLRGVRKMLPNVMLCLSTNGLVLPLFADALAAVGVGHVTVTVNAVTADVGGMVYDWVEDANVRLRGFDGASLLVKRQEEGIRRLKSLGIVVKVNTVVMPGINAAQLADIAQSVAAWGADLMNCIPHLSVPGTRLAGKAPSATCMEEVRASAGRFLPQMRHCTRCRADAVGLLGGGGIVRDVIGKDCGAKKSAKLFGDGLRAL